eukprot:GGOE01061442.1.p1 GENE.GGOE01061442.1~~GGOE01061442.1.p1  ORF type:complete len:216 (-),score=37.88 GGOE01061442.1:489-1094(-)
MMPVSSAAADSVAEDLTKAAKSEMKAMTDNVKAAASSKAAALEKSLKSVTGSLLSTVKMEPPTREFKVDFKRVLRADEYGYIRFKGDGTLELERSRNAEGVPLPQDRQLTWTLKRDEKITICEPSAVRGGAVAISFPRRQTDRKVEGKDTKELYIAFGGGSWNVGAAKCRQFSDTLYRELQHWLAGTDSGDLMGEAIKASI